MEKPEVGQRVWVYDVNGHRKGQPYNGWPATVTSVGRTIVYVEIDGSRHLAKFYMKTQQGTSKEWGSHTCYRTTEQRELDMRKTAAYRKLRENGVEFRLGTHLPLEHLEALAAVFPDKEETS